MKKKIMITELLNNIKKHSSIYFLFNVGKEITWEQRKKNWKHWVLLGGGPNADGSYSQQELRLIGPTAAGPKAILDPAAVGPKAIFGLFGIGSNSNGSC